MKNKSIDYMIAILNGFIVLLGYIAVFSVIGLIFAVLPNSIYLYFAISITLALTGLNMFLDLTSKVEIKKVTEFLSVQTSFIIALTVTMFIAFITYLFVGKINFIVQLISVITCSAIFIHLEQDLFKKFKIKRSN